MSRIDTWMPLYISDYVVDTMHLTTLEHGAYLLLIMEYWRKGPLPDDDKQLAAIAKLDRRTWDKDVGVALRGFFKRDASDGLLHQKRVDEERHKASELSEKRRVAAKQRTPKPQQTDSNSSAIAGAIASVLLTSVSRDLSQDSSLRSESPQLPETKQQEVESAVPADSCAIEPKKLAREGEPWGFGQWYSLYPKKVGRGEAVKAYVKATRRGASDEDILAGLLRYQFNSDPHFHPLPATWLNKCRWENELGTLPPNTERRRDPRREAADAILGISGCRPRRREGVVVDLDCGDWRNG